MEAGEWRLGRSTLSRNGRFDPVKTLAQSSSLLMTRELIDRVGPWKPAAECYGESPQEFLFRAWRRGFSLRTVPHLTVLLFPSQEKALSYLDKASPEHDYFWRR
jgi:GT2 family glycosyltransferase